MTQKDKDFQNGYNNHSFGNQNSADYRQGQQLRNTHNYIGKEIIIPMIIFLIVGAMFAAFMQYVATAIVAIFLPLYIGFIIYYKSFLKLNKDKKPLIENHMSNEKAKLRVSFIYTTIGAIVLGLVYYVVYAFFNSISETEISNTLLHPILVFIPILILFTGISRIKYQIAIIDDSVKEHNFQKPDTIKSLVLPTFISAIFCVALIAIMPQINMLNKVDLSEYNFTTSNGEGVTIVIEKDGWKFKGFEDKVILLNFFNTEDRIAKAQTPMLLNVRNKLKENFEILAVNVGNTGATVEKFINKFNVTYPVVTGKETKRLFNTVMNKNPNASIPFMVLFDKKGQFVQYYTGMIPENMLFNDISRAVSSN